MVNNNRHLLTGHSYYLFKEYEYLFEDIAWMFLKQRGRRLFKAVRVIE